VVARDDDQGPNSQLSYVLLGGNEDNAFVLTASGELRVTQSLDREARDHFVLVVTAADAGVFLPLCSVVNQILSRK
jgi:protocadherin Fat 4